MTSDIRVLHVLPSYSSDGTTGGPARVAEAQTTALRQDGISATLVAPAYKSGGFETSHSRRLFRMIQLPGLGPAGIFSPGLILWFMREVRKYHVIHVHLSRDLTTLPIALLAIFRGATLVVQPHGMIDSSSRLLARIVDTIATRRVLRRANTILTLSAREASDLNQVSRHELTSITELWNTVQVPERRPRPYTPGPEVLFLARLHERKRPGIFVQAAVELIRTGTDAQFTLIGPDEGAIQNELRYIEELGLDSRITWHGAIPADMVINRLSSAYLYVLPARNEPFGLTVIEALAAGTPVVVADDAVLAQMIRESEAGETFDGTASDLARVIDSYLQNSSKREAHSESAHQMAVRDFSDAALGKRMSAIYHATLSGVEA